MGKHTVDWRAPVRERMRQTGESFRQAHLALRAGQAPQPYDGPRETAFVRHLDPRRRPRDGRCAVRAMFRERARRDGQFHEFSQHCVVRGPHNVHFNGDDRDPIRWTEAGLVAVGEPERRR